MAELIAYYDRPLREPALTVDPTLYLDARVRRTVLNDENTRLYDGKFRVLSLLSAISSAREDVVFLPEDSSGELNGFRNSDSAMYAFWYMLHYS